MDPHSAVIVQALRSPVGKRGGALANMRPDDMLAVLLKEAAARTKIAVDKIDDVVIGCANQAGEDNRDIARMSALLAGFPVTVPGVTINRICASGLDAVVHAARMVRLGDAEIVFAGGVESMSRAPWAMPKPEMGYPVGHTQLFDTALGWRFTNPLFEQRFAAENPGLRAENVAELYKVSREEQDRYALQSHKRAIEAQMAGAFDDEILPFTLKQKKGPDIIFDRDESPRIDSSLEKLARLKPIFKENGTVTAGNCAPTNDGAAVLVITSLKKARDLGLTPLARVAESAVSGVDPKVMPTGPIPATRKLLERTGLKMADIDLVEFNEAFAVQLLVCMKELGMTPAQVNIKGGALALGHPLGMSGARIVTTLVHSMHQRNARYGMATIGVGVGQGQSVLFERVD